MSLAADSAQQSTKTSSSSTFTFKAPYPPGSTSTGSQGVSKQRRVSLALPNTPRVVPSWTFRDDTTVAAHGSSMASAAEKRGKMRRAVSSASDSAREGEAVIVPEKRQRKKWTEEETQMLVNGCNIWGVGNWKAILNDPSLKFDNRSPVDLKDRFRTFFPDAYKLHYPNAKTHLSSKVRSTLPDGSSLFEKTRSKKRRPFTAEEDAALKAGYEKYGTVWSTIVKDPIFQEQKRRSTDLRDRFRNAFPTLYQAAGYKPRTAPKKKRFEPSGRKASDDQLISHRMAGPYRRRRSRTTSGHSYSVPQSNACSDDDDTSDEEDELFDDTTGAMSPMKEMTPQPEPQMTSEDVLNEVTMHTIDQLDELPFSDFMPESSQTHSDSTTDHSIWSLGHRSPHQGFDSWSSAVSTTTVSPTSSHLSVSDYFLESNTLGRRDGMNMIGKSAWGTNDWLAGNPRLGVDSSQTPGSSSSHSHADADSNADYISSPPPGSPFSLSQLAHGIMDRYDLFQNNAFAHEVTSEVGPSDAYSTFSDPELFPTQSMRGFTHHSNYAGDLIFGARTHQPVQPAALGSFSGLGLGLSGMQAEQTHTQANGVNPLQLHTPGLAGIDELAAISLDDEEPLIRSHQPARTTAEIGVQANESDVFTVDEVMDLSSIIHLPPQTMEEIVGLSSGMGTVDVTAAAIRSDSTEMDSTATDPDPEENATPPATPAQTGRVPRELHNSSSPSYSTHNRSMSVPPFERVSRQQEQDPAIHGHATPQLATLRSLSQYGLPHFQTHPIAGSSSQVASGASSGSNFFSPSNGSLGLAMQPNLTNEVSLKSLDLSDLLFLDLHAPEPPLFDVGEAAVEHGRAGTALDLAKSYSHHLASTAPMPSLTTASYALSAGNMESNNASFASAAAPSARKTSVGTRSSSPSPMFDMETIGRSAGNSLHHRVHSQTSVSPKDLFLDYGSRSKRASWDGGAL